MTRRTGKGNWVRSALAVTAALVLCVGALMLQRVNPAAAEEIVSSYPYTTVTNDTVNIRASRSTKSTLLGRIPKGAEISVLLKNGDWVQVTYGKIKGYVMAKYVVLKTVQKIKTTPTPTPVQTLSPQENAGGYPVLKKGTSGRYVVALQEALIELGFLTGGADGNFGDATERAVIAFQRKNDYPDTGLMDANIQAFLFAGKPLNAKGTAVKLNTLSPVPGVTMKLNNTGALVGELQSALKALGYYTGAVNKTYDAATKKAVAAFQKQNGLKSDGLAGAETRALIESGKGLAAGTTPTPTPSPTPTATPVPVYEIPSTTVRSGSSGKDAKAVQQRLYELGYYRGAMDGNFGRASVNALKSFQANNGLKSDGVAGKGTYQKLFHYSAIPFRVEETATPTPTPTPKPTPTPTPYKSVWTTLRKGMKNDDVKLLQENLILLGYLSGKADGTYGDQTVEAVTAFQKANKLTADGVAGAATQKLLFSGNAVAAPAPKVTAAANTIADSSTLRQGSTGAAVQALQARLIALGYLSGKADGVFGQKTTAAVAAFQKANKLTADGIAGKLTLAKISGSSAVSASTQAPATVTAAPSTTTITPSAVAALTGTPRAASVIYANWYTKIKAVAKQYPYVTVYDYATGISWQIHIFSVGAHADFEPVTANDTARMRRAFGGETTWTPKPVWAVFSNGQVYMASVHDTPHGVNHTTDNDFDGHACLHFPRTQEQVTSIGPYATSHQEAIDKGWAVTQSMAGVK